MRLIGGAGLLFCGPVPAQKPIRSGTRIAEEDRN
jgi:hypothetical protein